MKNEAWLALGVVALGLIILNKDKVIDALNPSRIVYPNTAISNTGLPMLRSLPMLENPVSPDINALGISYQGW